MNWRDKTQQRLFKAYFEKTGIQLFDEPIYDSEWEKEHLEDLAVLAQTKPLNAIPKLEKLVIEKPHIPTLKNYLQIAYSVGGKTAKANALGERTLKEHPNYLFGITTKILNTRDKEELKKIGHLLGTPRDVREIEGYDKPVHLSAFKNYQHAAAYYESIMKENKSSVERLESLMDVGVEDEFVHFVANRLAIARIQNFQDRLSDSQMARRAVEIIQKVHLTQVDSAPTLNHEILNNLYTTDLNSLDKTIQDQILQLPRASLIEDLEKVLEDSMKRWTEHYKFTEYNERTHAFSTHALHYLGALKSESSLPKILDLIRMGKDFVEYWFSDWFEDLFYPSLYALGEGQLDLLQAFALEENISNFHKSIVCQVVSQVALHQPNRREEVIEWYKTVFQNFLDNPSNDNLIDTTFLTYSIGHLTDIRGIELLPLIEKINENNWLHEDFQGDINAVKKLLQEPYHASELKPLPKDLEEYYSRKYIERKIRRPSSPESAAILEQFENKAEQLISKKFSDLFFGDKGNNQEFEEDYPDDLFYNEPVKTVVRTTPKIGRNDPCSCGSGKKYKKCCLRK